MPQQQVPDLSANEKPAPREWPAGQVPSIGRVVHYQKYGTPGGEHKSEPSAAMITQVLDDQGKCQIFVMNPNGLYFNPTPYADVPTPGHWNWPPRV